MTEDSEAEKQGLTILHYGMLGLVACNLIINAVLLMTVRNNQKIAITAEAFARIAAQDRVTDSELKNLLDHRDMQIEELQKRLEAIEGQP